MLFCFCFTSAAQAFGIQVESVPYISHISFLLFNVQCAFILLQLISFFNMSNPFVTLCSTGQFSSFFYSPLNPEFDIASLEQAVCKIDFEQLVMEFKDLVSFDEILEQVK